jgi:hypothetical protein
MAYGGDEEMNQELTKKFEAPKDRTFCIVRINHVTKEATLHRNSEDDAGNKVVWKKSHKLVLVEPSESGNRFNHS